MSLDWLCRLDQADVHIIQCTGSKKVLTHESNELLKIIYITWDYRLDFAIHLEK